MAQYHHNILAITYGELTDEIVTPYNYRNLTQRRKINVVRRGCKGTPALIAYDSLPEDIKKAYKDKYGDPRENSKYEAFTKYIEYDQEAYNTFSSYLLADGRTLKQELVNKYCKNAEVLRAIIRLKNDRIALRKALGGSTKNVWTGIANIVTELSGQIGHDLPKSPRSLERKVKEFQEFGYEILISGKFQNKNRSKICDIQQEATLRQLFRHHNNLDNELICSIYNTMADTLEWECITAQTVGNYRQKWNIETVIGRRGEGVFDNNVAMQIRRKAPVLPLVYWTVDGWDAELFYQKTEPNSKGHNITTYTNRLTMVVVLDPCEKYPVGYAIGTHESPELIREAIRNAVNHTEELFGRKHKVLQLQTDNYAKKTLKPFYEAITEAYTPARVGNAKSKIIEPYFKYLNKKYCQLMPNWSGFGVTSKKDNQPNGEFLNKIRHSFPDEAGCRKQLHGIIEMERARKIEKYRFAYNHLPNEDKVFINETEYYLNLCETKEKTTRLQPQGFVFQIDNQKYVYESFDVNFRRNAHVDWTVKYDPSSMERVMVVNGDGSLRFMLEEPHTQPMALYDMQDGDSEKRKQINDFNKGIKAEIFESTNHDQDIVKNLFNDPRLVNTLGKFMLCDSNGQHKDRKNEARIRGAKMVEISERKELKEESKIFAQKREEYVKSKINIEEYINQ